MAEAEESARAAVAASAAADSVRQNGLALAAARGEASRLEEALTAARDSERQARTAAAAAAAELCSGSHDASRRRRPTRT